MVSRTKEKKREAEADIAMAEEKIEKAEGQKETAEMKRDVADLGEKIKKKLTR
ncbi:MAG: hypothetical protein GX307_01630 [Euryarchaeota archaeon]|nr:hypothetical protein [Euryarchaeota archaeon]